jgi:hypothetical protein
VQIVINLENVYKPGASQVENAQTLQNLLEFMVRENMNYLRRHPETPSLYRSGVVYGRTTWWEPIPAMRARGFGDCKSLTSALCAEYRLHGIWCRPVHRYNPRGDGNTDYHILLETENGWEDPSANLGMGAHENAPFFDEGSVGSDKFLDTWRDKLGSALKKKKGFLGLW